MHLCLSSKNILYVLRVKEAFRVLLVRLANVATPASQANGDRKVPEEREAHQLVLILCVCPLTSSCVCNSPAATHDSTDIPYSLCPVGGSL